MSPFRAVVFKSDDQPRAVIVAMLSVDPKTGRRNIYIVQKEGPSLITTPSEAEIAYAQTTRRNSNMLDAYEIVQTDAPGKHYTVFHYAPNPNEDSIDNCGTAPIQSKCLEIAMKHFCDKHRYTIVSTL